LSEIFHRLNWVDIFALILLLRVSYISLRIGVGKQIPPLLLLLFILILALYNYRIIARFFINKYDAYVSISYFLSYSLMTAALFVPYHYVSRVTGFIFFTGEAGLSAVERAGGLIFGFIRSIIMLGIIMIGLALCPVKFVEDGVLGSCSGIWFINADIKVYTSLMNLLPRDGKLSGAEERRAIIREKDRYFFESLKTDVKKRSRYYNEKK